MGLSVCPKCSKRKRGSSFAKGKNLCKLCFNVQHRAWVAANRDKGYQIDRYFQTLRSQHGLTLDQYHSFAEKQDFLCAICGEEPIARKRTSLDGYVVDHNHETGKVRGLLCHQCNAGIGFLKENVSTLSKAISYLTQ